MARNVALVFAVLLAACSQLTETSIDRVELTVRPGEVAAGDSLTATLVNRSEGILEYSFCPTALDRRTGSGWTTVQQPFGAREYEMCLGIGYELPPGGVAEYRQLVSADLDGGSYRLRMNVRIGDENSPLYSSEFRVVQ